MNYYPGSDNQERQSEETQFQILRYLGTIVTDNPRSTGSIEVVDTPVGQHDDRYVSGLRSMGSTIQLSSRAIISTAEDYKWSVLYAYDPDDVLPKHIVVASLPDDTFYKIIKRKYFIDPITGDVCHETLPRESRLRSITNCIKSVGYVAQNIALSHLEQTVIEAKRSPQLVATSPQSKRTLVNFLHSISRL